MFRFKKLMAPLLAMGVISCSDTNAPVIEGSMESPATRTSLNFLRWDSSSGALSFSATVSSESGELPPVAPTLGALMEGESDYSVSFWAVRGEYRALTIDYDEMSAAYGDESGHFLRLEIVDPVALADGTPIAVGDSVLITVTVDTDYLLAELQPSGIQFGSGTPTNLWMWYDGAEEYEANQSALGMWVQEDPNDPWSSVVAQHQITDRLFLSILEHFSGYAISW